ncbi:MAG: hypothetical protein ACLFQ1_10510 [Halochromatium sp.]|uniref:hypothetical protein n=1 Tax=Halochromatium sp. TaxID=2049430 RepID=UPI00397A4580
MVLTDTVGAPDALQQRLDRGLLPGEIALAAMLQDQSFVLVQLLQRLAILLIEGEPLRLVRQDLLDLDQAPLQRTAQGMERRGKA